MKPLAEIRAGVARQEAEQLRRSREAASRRRQRRPHTRSTIDKIQRSRMRRAIADMYASEHAPPAGSLRDRRLRAELSLRQLALLALVSHECIRRAEIASEQGDPNAVTGPVWRSIAHGLEKKSGRRVKLDDIRPKPADGR